MSEAIYYAARDCIEWIEPGEPAIQPCALLGPYVRPYVDKRTQALTGCTIDNVGGIIQQITARLPGFMRDMEGGIVRLDHLLTAYAWCFIDPNTRAAPIIKALRDYAQVCRVVVTGVNFPSSAPTPHPEGQGSVENV